jgi:hypothetical protein
MACSLGSELALAWGHDGHELIGAVADTLIAGKPAAMQVQQILGGESLQEASLWADCARNVNDKPPNHYAHNPQFPECDVFETPAEQQELESYVKRNLTACHPTGEQEVCHKQYHFTDVAIERNSYDHMDVGTSDHDVVGAIQACIAVLKGNPSPAPFDIQGKKEALRLLAHFVGDVHQPLHVAAVYLDTGGQTVDPDMGTFDPESGTRGGNLLKSGSQNLHHEWDTLPPSLKIGAFKTQAVSLAGMVPPTAGSPANWAVAWASETVIAGHKAFAGVTFGQEQSSGNSRHWPFQAPSGYSTKRRTLQKTQLVKAGARLAQLLEATWP